MVLITTSTLVLFADEEHQTTLEKVISAKHREMSSKRDQYRHPVETLQFFQIDKTQSILEIMPGSGGWYTEILAPMVRDKGELFVAQFNPDSEMNSNYRKRTIKKYNMKLASNPKLYDQVKMVIFNPPGDYQLGAPESVDRILTFRNLHNWVDEETEVLVIFKAFYDVLKKGGKLGLVDHRLPVERTKRTNGYVKQSYAIKMAESAGFILENSSEINANPKDTADHPKGVWTLPPSYEMKNKDREKYTAIGESDRMTLLFVKK